MRCHSVGNCFLKMLHVYTCHQCNKAHFNVISRRNVIGSLEWSLKIYQIKTMPFKRDIPGLDIYLDIYLGKVMYEYTLRYG